MMNKSQRSTTCARIADVLNGSSCRRRSIICFLLLFLFRARVIMASDVTVGGAHTHCVFPLFRAHGPTLSSYYPSSPAGWCSMCIVTYCRNAIIIYVLRPCVSRVYVTFCLTNANNCTNVRCGRSLAL